MTDLNPEGIEKAAERLFYLSDTADAGNMKWNMVISEFRDYYRTRARAAVIAYEAHMHPTITTVDDLPVGTLIQMKGIPSPFLLTDDGWESTRFAGKPVHDYIADPERYPARVLHWGDR